jgi:two-component system phosphate regulon sensor histidine kinase PhoR
VDREKAQGGSLRSAALRGAALAAVLLLAVAAARDHLDGWLLGAAALGVAASGLLLGRRPERDRRLPRPEESEQRLAVAETLLANIPDPVILVDRRALVIEANDAARALLPALKARQPLSFALRAPDVLDGIDEVVKTGRLLKVEYTERIPAERAFEVQIGPLRGPGGAEPGGGLTVGGRPSVMLFFRDLTSARRLEHMRVDFVANASHELRTPLASLLGFIETLQGPARNDPAARERFLEIMRDQARRMTRLIDDLLSLSRIELRAHVPPADAIDLLPLVRHMIDSLGPLARESGVAIAFEADEGPLTILGDRDEVLRVVENLIENAVKYGASGGRIEVSARRHPPADARPAADARPGGSSSTCATTARGSPPSTCRA